MGVSISPELRAFIVGVVEERLKELRVSRDEFERLRVAVEESVKAIRELAEAQRRTEERIEELAAAQKGTEERIGGLAEAQRKTEERVSYLEDAVTKLAEAQRRTEEHVTRLGKAVMELAEAQRRSEERISRLEAAVERLADAQRRSEDRLTRLEAAVEKLTDAIDVLRVEVGRLSEAVGFGLEDLARDFLPCRLREEGIIVERLERRHFVVDGAEVEINLYGEGTMRGEAIVVVGEAKSRIYGRDVARHASIAQKIEGIVGRRAVKLMFGFAIHPSAREEAKKLDVKLYTAYRT
ncbi:MAG: hypothetical protein DRN90_05535 [Thermoproteota archaeon]|nr:MAG: hypothetical protein DRN90_05535 [Candidatus Korarchaeota archaeon]